jgi:hypothetical protein
MRLTEFYALAESKTQHFTIEPESNGVGRLLSWETSHYTGSDSDDTQDDTAYEVVAHGDIEKLLHQLAKMMPAAMRFEGDIRQAYEECVSDGGQAVYVYAGGVDITVKAGKGAVQIEDVEY